MFPSRFHLLSLMAPWCVIALSKAHARGVEPPIVVWERTFEDIQAITGDNIIRSRDGSYVAAGRTHDNQTGEERMCLLALDGEGKVLWKNTSLGNPTSFYNEGQAVFESEQGFVVLGGTIPFPDATPGLHIAEVDGQGKE